MKPLGLTIGDPLLLKVPGQPDQKLVVAAFTKRGTVLHGIADTSNGSPVPPKKVDQTITKELWLNGEV